MKKLITTLLPFPVLLFAQEKEHQSLFSNNIFRNLHGTYGTIDLYYLSSEIHKDRMNGFGFGMGFTLNDFWMPGFTFEFFNSRSVQLDAAIPVINPAYNTSLFEFNNEFIIGSNQVVSLGIPLRFGVGYTNYYDRYDNNNNNTNRSLIDDSYFIADGGLNLYINIFKHISLAGGATYRYASGVQRVGTNEDFNNYSFSGKLRFRIFNSNKPAPVQQPQIN